MSTGFKNGAIHLHDGVFYSGQTLSGSINFDLDHSLTFSVLYVKYSGEAKVLWTESEVEVINGSKYEHNVEYTAHEEYFNYTENLLGGQGTAQLPPGSHAIPFKYVIPSIAPSSFNSTKGQIHYTVTAVLMQLTAQEEISKEFEVVSPFDLNLGDPSIREPIHVEFEELYGCNCLCSQDPVTIRIQLPVSGYCPGQDIPVDVEVQNESSVEITKMVFEILSKECYRTDQSEFMPPAQVLAKVKKGAVPANTEAHFTCPVPVPAMLAPHLDSCSIIDVQYYLRVTIKLSGCNDEMQDESEIYIGLVPIKEFTEGEYIHPLANRLPRGPIPVANDQSPLTNHFVEPTNTGVNRFPYQNPCDNPPYPIDSKVEIPLSTVGKPAPYRDYQIGFKVPETIPDPVLPYPGVNPPYPSTNLIPSALPPYPTDNLMPQLNMPSYPTDNLMPQVNMPYSNHAIRPSAPPE